MEFLPGPSLKSLLSKHEALDLDRIGTIMHGLLTGLQHSHGRGVVHRDIKPANIVFSADGEVKITDFGIAHLDASGMTRAGSVLGTPAYMAPEQVLGDPVDARTDLFSAGVVLYEMLTGRRPFEGSTSSIMHKIVHLEPPQPSRLTATVSAGFDAVIARAIAKNPADRYQSAAAFDEALRAELQRKPALAAAEPPGAPDTTVAVHRPPPPRRQVEPPTPMARASALRGVPRRNDRPGRGWSAPPACWRWALPPGWPWRRAASTGAQACSPRRPRRRRRLPSPRRRHQQRRHQQRRHQQRRHQQRRHRQRRHRRRRVRPPNRSAMPSPLRPRRRRHRPRSTPPRSHTQGAGDRTARGPHDDGKRRTGAAAPAGAGDRRHRPVLGHNR